MSPIYITKRSLVARLSSRRRDDDDNDEGRHSAGVNGAHSRDVRLLPHRPWRLLVADGGILEKFSGQLLMSKRLQLFALNEFTARQQAFTALHSRFNGGRIRAKTVKLRI